MSQVAFVSSDLLLNAIPQVFVTISHLLQQSNFSFAPSFHYLPALPSLPFLFLSLLCLLQSLAGLFFNCFCFPITLSFNGNPKPPHSLIKLLLPGTPLPTISHLPHQKALALGFSRNNVSLFVKQLCSPISI